MSQQHQGNYTKMRATMCVHVFYRALYENIDDFLCVLLVCLYTIDLYMRICAIHVFL